MQNILLLLSYFLWVIFIIAGIWNTIDWNLNGALFLPFGILLLPIVFYWIKWFFNTDNYKRNYIIIYLISFFVLGFSIPVDDTSSGKKLKSTTSLTDVSISTVSQKSEYVDIAEVIMEKPKEEVVVDEALEQEEEKKRKELEEHNKHNHKITFYDSNIYLDLEIKDISVETIENGFTSQKEKYWEYTKEPWYVPTIYFDITNPSNKVYNVPETWIIPAYIKVDDNAEYKSLPYFKGLWCRWWGPCWSVMWKRTYADGGNILRDINFQPNETKRFKVEFKMLTEDITVVRFWDFRIEGNKELWFYINLRDKKVVRKIIENK